MSWFWNFFGSLYNINIYVSLLNKSVNGKGIVLNFLKIKLFVEVVVLKKWFYCCLNEFVVMIGWVFDVVVIGIRFNWWGFFCLCKWVFGVFFYFVFFYWGRINISN